MLIKIYLKDLRSNVQQYVFYFCGIVLSNIFYYCFAKMVFRYYGDGLRDGYEFAEMRTYQSLMVFVSVLFLIVILRFYVTSRKESYVITSVLGEPSRITTLRVGLELLVLWGGSSALSAVLEIGGEMILGTLTRKMPDIYWNGLWEMIKYSAVIWMIGSCVCFVTLFHREQKRHKAAHKKSRDWKWNLQRSYWGWRCVGAVSCIIRAVPMCQLRIFVY